jgi:hypothetical protein
VVIFGFRSSRHYLVHDLYYGSFELAMATEFDYAPGAKWSQTPCGIAPNGVAAARKASRKTLMPRYGRRDTMLDDARTATEPLPIDSR